MRYPWVFRAPGANVPEPPLAEVKTASTHVQVDIAAPTLASTAGLRLPIADDWVATIFRDHKAELAHCYAVERSNQAELAGSVIFAVTIGATGAVTDAQIPETTLNNARAERCMLERVRQWRFPEAKSVQMAVRSAWEFRPLGWGFRKVNPGDGSSLATFEPTLWLPARTLPIDVEGSNRAPGASSFSRDGLTPLSVEH